MSSIFERHLESLRDQSALARQKAARALGNTRDPAAVAPLLDQLWQEQDKVVRSKIIEALDRIGDQRVVDPLLQMLLSETDDVRAEQMLRVVIRLAGPSVAESLLDVLSLHHNYNIQREIVRLLGDIRHQAALHPLLHLLERLDYQQTYHNQALRTAILRALGQLRDVRALPTLMTLLEKGTARPHEIINAIGLIGDHDALPTLLHYLLHAPDLISQGAARMAFANMVDERDVDLLLDLLEYDDLDVRLMAIKALGRVGDGRAVDNLVGVLHEPKAQLARRSDEDTNRRLREAVISALATIGDERAIPHLQKYWLWPVARRAIRAIRHG